MTQSNYLSCLTVPFSEKAAAAQYLKDNNLYYINNVVARFGNHTGDHPVDQITFLYSPVPLTFELPEIGVKEDQLNDGHYIYKENYKKIFNTTELNSGKYLIKDFSFGDLWEWYKQSNNVEKITAIDYITDENITKKENITFDYKSKNKDIFRTRLYYQLKINLNDEITENEQNKVFTAIKSIGANHKKSQYSFTKLNTSLYFNSQGIFLVNNGNYLINDTVVNFTKKDSSLMIHNFNLLLKVYESLVKDWGYCDISFLTDENLYIVLTAGNSCYKFNIKITENLELRIPEKNIDIYSNLEFSNDFRIKLEYPDTVEALTKFFLVHINNLNKNAKKRLLGVKSRKNDIYIVPCGMYVSSQTKKQTDVIALINKKLTLDLFNNCSVKITNIDNFYQVLAPYWISEPYYLKTSTTITYDLIEVNDGYQFIAIKDNKTIASIDINCYCPTDENIVTEFLRQENDKDQVLAAA